MAGERRELTVGEAAAQRVSIRKYTNEPVPPEDVRRILDLAGRAPSQQNTQPWRVIAVQDHETRQRLMAAAYNQPQVGAAPVVFVVYSDMLEVAELANESVHPGFQGEERERRRASLAEAILKMEEAERECMGAGMAYIFIGYLLLVAQSMGYGTSPMLGFEPDKVKQMFSLPAHCRIPALVAMGRPNESGFPQFRRPLERWARFI